MNGEDSTVTDQTPCSPERSGTDESVQQQQEQQSGLTKGDSDRPAEGDPASDVSNNVKHDPGSVDGDFTTNENSTRSTTAGHHDEEMVEVAVQEPSKFPEEDLKKLEEMINRFEMDYLNMSLIVRSLWFLIFGKITNCRMVYSMYTHPL